MLAENLADTVTTTYSKLDFTDSGRGILRNVIRLINDRPEPSLTEADYEKIESEFLHKLKYLNEYGTGAWRVRLASDFGSRYNFGLTWFFNGEAAMQGLLQFNGVREPFASVVIGEIRWWSIHT